MSAPSECLVWRKSSASLNGDCVEVASWADGVALRDSKDREGAVVTVSHGEWRAFVHAAKQGRFDGR